MIRHVSNTYKRSFGEEICKNVLEKIYGVSFEHARPNWLKNPETGRNLELDCYNENMKLAVEYNNIRHYKWSHFMSKTRKEYKYEMCEREGIYIIIVPYTVKYEDIPYYIVSNLPEIKEGKIKIENILSKIKN